jgi:hypothetical protein
MKDSRGRPYVHIDRGDLDFRDVEGPKLPDGVVVCFSCLGNGKKVQRYCDAPTMTGVCESYLCAGSGFLYEETCRGVPTSVTNQIAGMNGLEQAMPWRAVSMYGLRWQRRPQDSAEGNANG